MFWFYLAIQNEIDFLSLFYFFSALGYPLNEFIVIRFMKFAIVIFPGSNCDRDTVWALQKTMYCQISMVGHEQRDLGNPDLVIIPGGFSYGDYLRAGAIARYSPVMESVLAFSKKGGSILGICNGFQILCESELLPGTLITNQNGLFCSKNTFIRTENNETLLSCDLKKHQILKIPIANKEGRYYAAKETLKTLNDNQQIVFRYCNENGEADTLSNYGGSDENIAGICNAKKNVFGIMPHPERAVDIDYGNTDGQLIFQSIQKFFFRK